MFNLQWQGQNFGWGGTTSKNTQLFIVKQI